MMRPHATRTRTARRRHFMRRQDTRRLRALAAVSLVAIALCLQLSHWLTPSRVASAQTTNAPAAVQTQTSPTAAAAIALTPEERRGKQIYLRGTSASGREVTAYL